MSHYWYRIASGRTNRPYIIQPVQRTAYSVLKTLFSFQALNQPSILSRVSSMSLGFGKEARRSESDHQILCLLNCKPVLAEGLKLKES